MGQARLKDIIKNGENDTVAPKEAKTRLPDNVIETLRFNQRIGSGG